MRALTLLEKIAVGVARYYGCPARCWWADREELQQEAWSAMLYALPHHDPAQAELSTYLKQVADNAVVGWLRDNGAPTSGYRQPFMAPDDLVSANKLRAVLRHDGPEVELVVHEKLWMEKAAAEVRRVVERGGGELAVKVLLEEEKAPEVAKDHAVPVNAVYRAAARARAAVETSYNLWEIARCL